jgi:hypothetical protein
MASTRRGFVTFWIDNFAGGVPQIWASVVTIRG